MSAETKGKDRPQQPTGRLAHFRRRQAAGISLEVSGPEGAQAARAAQAQRSVRGHSLPGVHLRAHMTGAISEG